MPAAVLIVGAGPTGLSMALSLLRNGVPVRIIDKAPEPRVGQKGFGIQPRTLEVLHLLGGGILDEVLERASYIKNMLIYEMPGAVRVAKELETTPRVPPTPDKPWPDSRLLGQDRFEAILTRHLEAAGGKVERDVELVGFAQDEDRVYAELRKVDFAESMKVDFTGSTQADHLADSKRSDGSIEHAQRDTEHAQFDFLVGCDGGHSIVRRLLGLAFVGETRDAEWSLIADVVVRGLDSNYWHIFSNGSGPKDMRLTLRSADIPELSTIIGSGDRDTYTDPHDALAALIKDFYAITGRTDIEFGEVKCASWYRPNIRMVDRFGDGRVFVAGDAAHTHSPAGGQGMNSGIQDGFNLAWKLALVHKKLAPLALLSTYSSERLPVITTMLQKTTEISETFVKAAYQKSTDRATGEWKRDGAMKQFGVNYRGSDIVLDERNPLLDAMPSAYGSGNGVLRAGDRAPSAPVRCATNERVQKLFDVFSCWRHTVLVFTGEEEVVRRAVDVVSSLPEGLLEVIIVAAPGKVHSGDELRVLEDFAGHARSIYQVEHDPTIVIIRPDGVVGAVVLEVDGIWRYFAKILGCVDSDSVFRL